MPPMKSDSFNSTGSGAEILAFKGFFEQVSLFYPVREFQNMAERSRAPQTAAENSEVGRAMWNSGVILSLFLLLPQVAYCSFK